jgi:hypothetical protein
MDLAEQIIAILLDSLLSTYLLRGPYVSHIAILPLTFTQISVVSTHVLPHFGSPNPIIKASVTSHALSPNTTSKMQPVYNPVPIHS